MLIIIFSIFFVILAIGYITTSQPGTVYATTQVVFGFVFHYSVNLLCLGAFRDSATFFYNYLILPSVLLLVSSALILIVYFAYKRWRLAKEVEDSAVFDLVERITGSNLVDNF